MLMQWTEDLATGIAEIDVQHQEIFACFDNFVSGCHKAQGQQTLMELFSFLDQYVTAHFAKEEALMERHGYPEADRHKEEHRGFREKLVALKEELEQRGATVELLVRTNKALAYWLSEHIRETDFRLAGFLRQTAED